MTLKLVVRSDANGGPEELLLSESSYSIGRLHDNDLTLQNDCVSGYHAELKRTPDGGYTVRDLKSTNGTFLNGTRVTSPENLKPGDRLKLGNLPILVEEHREVVTRPETESFPEGFHSKLVSLKDVFGFASEENFNTYPITPVRTPPPLGNGSVVPTIPVKMEKPAQVPETPAQQAEFAREAERAQQIERIREAERAQQIERAKEAERAQQAERALQIQRAREAEQAQQIERAREAERAQQAERALQIQRAREAEQAQQIERAKEAERAQQAERALQIQRAREAEQAQQIERAREAERAQQAERALQIQRAKEAERAQQIERAREAERAQQAERALQIQRAREAEQAQQIERAREAERAQLAERALQIQRAREAEQAHQIERAREAERVQQAERALQIERAKEAERAQQAERARQARQAEVDLREKPALASGDDSGSKIQFLTAQLERAMQEINRLRTFISRESPKTVETGDRSAGPAIPIPPIASDREEQAPQRSGIVVGKVMPTEPERELRPGGREAVCVGNHNPPPLQYQNSENEVAFATHRNPPILSTAHLRQLLEAARSAGKRFAGTEARPHGENARPGE